MKKMRKLLSAMLALMLGVSAACGLTACGKDQHTHTFGEWTHETGIENCVGSVLKRTCSDCSYVEERTGTAEDHLFTEYGYDITRHWLDCTFCEETTGEDVHEEDGAGNCKHCKTLLPTECVTYEISEDGTYAIVTGYDESETDIVVVSDVYEGLPVKEIAASAFKNCEDLERIALHDTITTIGDQAFYGCSSLTGVLLCDSVVSVGDEVFAECNANIRIYCEAESKPEGWSETWALEIYKVIWGYQGKNMSNVSVQAVRISDGMLAMNGDDPSLMQIDPNPNNGGVQAPDGFFEISRFDAKTEGSRAWGAGKSALWNYNFDRTDLKDYQEIWFAVKMTHASWVVVGDRTKDVPDGAWVYFHFEQVGKDEIGNILWDIEMSIGGYVCYVEKNQNGKAIEKERPVNSIARMLWDDAFSSATSAGGDGNAFLIYSEYNEGISFYCTEVVGLRKWA